MVSGSVSLWGDGCNVGICGCVVGVEKDESFGCGVSCGVCVGCGGWEGSWEGPSLALVDV